MIGDWRFCPSKVLSFAHTYLCDTPFCSISRDTPPGNKHERASRYFGYKYRAIEEVCHRFWASKLGEMTFNPATKLDMFCLSQPQSITQKGVHARPLTAREREHRGFAAFEPLSSHEFRASIARTPFCAILWRSPTVAFSRGMSPHKSGWPRTTLGCSPPLDAQEPLS